MNILTLLAMPFYSPVGFFRLYHKKTYFYFFLSAFPMLTYFYSLSTLFNLINIEFNFLMIFGLSVMFYIFSILKNSLFFSIISLKFKNVDFKTIFSINAISLYPFFIFLPISNLLKGIWGIDIFIFILPFFISTFLKKKYFRKINGEDTILYLIFPLTNFLVIITLITVIIFVGISGLAIIFQIIKDIIL